jgi:hypothetical protein
MELERVLLMALAKENLVLACWLLLVPNGDFFFVCWQLKILLWIVAWLSWKSI